MFDYLHGLPNIVVVILFGGTVLLAISVLPFLLCPLLRIKGDKDTTDFAVRGQATVISFLAIVLGFSLVTAQSNLRTIEAHVATEANDINQMDRLLVRYGDVHVNEMRALLANYAQSIIDVEWPLMVRGAEVTLESKGPPPLGQLSRAVFTIEPAAGRQTEIYNQILKQMDDLTEARSQRIEDSSIRLPATFWGIILALFCILFVLALLIEPAAGRAIAIGAQALAVALLLSLVFIYDAPFKGRSLVQPSDIVKVIDQMKNRTS